MCVVCHLAYMCVPNASQLGYKAGLLMPWMSCSIGTFFNPEHLLSHGHDSCCRLVGYLGVI